MLIHARGVGCHRHQHAHKRSMSRSTIILPRLRCAGTGEGGGGRGGRGGGRTASRKTLRAAAGSLSLSRSRSESSTARSIDNSLCGSVFPDNAEADLLVRCSFPDVDDISTATSSNARALQGARPCSQSMNNYFTEACSGSEAGSHLRIVDFCVTQLWA